MRLICLISLLVLILGLASWSCTLGEANSGHHLLRPVESAQTGAEELATRRRLPALFDFQKYKQIFHKHYGSLVEEMRRRSLFIPRVLRIIGCALRYMYRKMDYFCAVNHMTDYLPDELERMQNHMLGRSSKQEQEQQEQQEQQQQQQQQQQQRQSMETPKENYEEQTEDVSVSETDDQLSSDLEGLVEEMPAIGRLIDEQKTTKTSQQNGRYRRSLLSLANKALAMLPPRPLEFDSLIKNLDKLTFTLPGGDKLQPESQQENIEEPPQVKRKKLSEQIKPVDMYALASKTRNLTHDELIRIAKMELRRAIGAQSSNKNAIEVKPEPLEEKDELFLDHSQGGCMDMVRTQGQCGSCYAFATVAVFEWFYCKKYGKLERFSEQYMVDCGDQYIDRMNGCEGASIRSMMHFVSNFGLEKRINYPYRGKKQQCLYEEEKTANISSTGYMRFDSSVYYRVPYDLYEEYLFFAPLVVSIIIKGTDFMHYGGGIHQLKSCDQNTYDGHAVVLVGHGKQDGVEYWKIRNSHSVGWGEQGYYRVSKDSRKCFNDETVALGTSNGKTYMLDKLRHNELHDRRLIKKMYWRQEADKKRKAEEQFNSTASEVFHDTLETFVDETKQEAKRRKYYDAKSSF